MATDACLTAVGRQMEKQYSNKEIPQAILNISGVHIMHSELYAILVGLGTSTKGIRFKVFCDSEAVSTVLNTGKASDRILQNLLWEAVFIQANWNFELST